MSGETMLISAAFVLPFVIFAVVLAWADAQTRDLPQPQEAAGKPATLRRAA